MAAWPESTLPLLNINKFGYKSADNNLARTDMEAGPARQRRRFTTGPKTLEASWVLSAAQLALFETFHDVTVEGGSAWFTMPVPIGGLNSVRTVRFVEGYEVRAAAREFSYEVSAKLEVRAV